LDTSIFCPGDCAKIKADVAAMIEMMNFFMRRAKKNVPIAFRVTFHDRS
jgi:hypothetical protein